MARKSITEYKAKTLLYEHLGLSYKGIQVTISDLSPLATLDTTNTYVVKVDQGVKKRLKHGLVILEVSFEKLQEAIGMLSKKGYTQFLIEPYEEHEASSERYLAFQRIREGIQISVSEKGGVNVEEHKEHVQHMLVRHSVVDKGLVPLSETQFDSRISENDAKKIADMIYVPKKFLIKLLDAIEKFHITFLEINPLVVRDGNILFLDVAIEVDSAAEFFVNHAWSSKDFVSSTKQKTPEEAVVEELSRKSQASFRLVVLNPNGSIFMLLSGGGASIVLADEVYNLGFGKELANYGEYSGNPNSEETYLYTRQLLRLLVKSKARKKVLIIGGGVANFTDVRVTFQGIIQALDEIKNQLQKEEVKIYVRRGGPYQDEGLAMMKAYLEKEKMYGLVAGPEMVLTSIVTEALQGGTR